MTYKSARELESDVDDTFPVNRTTGVVDGWLEASSFDSIDGCFSKAMAEIAGDSDDLHASGGRDMDADRNNTFNVKTGGLCGVLRLRFI